MNKINFRNGQSPALNGTNLNQLQTNIEEAINVVQGNLDDAKNELGYNVISNGEPVKTGRKIDGKDEYIKRISVTLGTPSSAGGTTKMWEIDSGLSSFKMTMPLLACIDINGSIQEANIVRFSAYAEGITLNPTSSHCFIDEGTGIISFLTAGSDRSGKTFIANIHFTYNN